MAGDGDDDPALRSEGGVGLGVVDNRRDGFPGISGAGDGFAEIEKARKLWARWQRD